MSEAQMWLVSSAAALYMIAYAIASGKRFELRNPLKRRERN